MERKLYACFLWKDAEGYLQVEHYIFNDRYFPMRAREVLNTLGRDKVEWFFCSNQKHLYLKYLIKARIIALRDLSVAYQLQLARMVADDLPVGVLADTRRVQNEIEEQEMFNLGRSVSRYFITCERMDIEPDPVDEVALMCLDYYEKYGKR